MASPSPSKSRKLSPAQQAGPQSGRSANMSTPPLEPASTFPLFDLFGGTHGSALDVYTIVHSKEVQRRFDQVGVHFGVQWELARGVSTQKWEWKDVLQKMNEDFDGFRTSNSQWAGRVPAIMAGFTEAEPCDLALWYAFESIYTHHI